jgi:hypothetical protein
MCADARACAMIIAIGHNRRRYLHIEAVFVSNALLDHLY